MSSTEQPDLKFDETSRLAALRDYDLLDSPEEKDFDLLVEVAAQICDVPYAFISLIDRNRVWHKSTFGFGRQEVPRQESYCSLAIQQDQLLMIPDVSKDSRTANIGASRGNTSAGMYSGANLITPDGHRIGTLCVLDTRPRTLTDKQQAILIGLSKQVMSLIELRKLTRELDNANKKLLDIANEDVLTGLATRRALIERLNLEIDRARRYPGCLSLVMMDLDHFKQINDKYDHAMGDAVLKRVGSLIREKIRKVDIAGRYGGEEFCLVLPGTDQAGALKFANLLRSQISDALVHDNGRSVRFTASFGVFTAEPGQSLTSEQMMRAADQGLYEAKNGGRNRVVVGKL